MIIDSKRGIEFAKRAGTTNPKKCNYPNDRTWSISTTTSSPFVDTYSNEFKYPELVDCGLTFVGEDVNYAYFNTTLVIERHFTIGNGRFAFNREFSVDQVVSLEFPKKLSVSSNVVISNNTVEFYAAVTGVNFDHINQEWTITISTSINKPYYKLALASEPSNPHPSNGITRPFVRDQSVNNVVNCPGNTADCQQQWVFKTPYCSSLNLAALTLDFDVKCINGPTPNVDTSLGFPNGHCASPKVGSIESIISLVTGDVCPIHKDFVISAPIMKTYQSDYSTPKELFGISETVYLAADFIAPPAKITAISVSNVCAYARLAPGTKAKTDCPTENLVSLLEVTTDSTLGANSKINFHVLAGLLKAASQVPENTNELTIQAELSITYDGTFTNSNKRVAPIVQVYSIVHDLSINGETENIELPFDKSAASANTFGIIVLILATAALL